MFYLEGITLHDKLLTKYKTLPKKHNESSYDGRTQIVVPSKLNTEKICHPKRYTGANDVTNKNQSSTVGFFDKVVDGFVNFFSSNELETTNKLNSTNAQ